MLIHPSAVRRAISHVANLHGARVDYTIAPGNWNSASIHLNGQSRRVHYLPWPTSWSAYVTVMRAVRSAIKQMETHQPPQARKLVDIVLPPGHFNADADVSQDARRHKEARHHA